MRGVSRRADRCRVASRSYHARKSRTGFAPRSALCAPRGATVDVRIVYVYIPLSSSAPRTIKRKALLKGRIAHAYKNPCSTAESVRYRDDPRARRDQRRERSNRHD